MKEIGGVEVDEELNLPLQSTTMVPWTDWHTSQAFDQVEDRRQGEVKILLFIKYLI